MRQLIATVLANLPFCWPLAHSEYYKALVRRVCVLFYLVINFKRFESQPYRLFGRLIKSYDFLQQPWDFAGLGRSF